MKEKNKAVIANIAIRDFVASELYPLDIALLKTELDLKMLSSKENRGTYF